MPVSTGRKTGVRREMGGEEALAIGAFKAGVRFVTGFPGRPSAKTLHLLSVVGKDRGIAASWAVNGKVALEEAIGASLLSRRALVCLPASALSTAQESLIAAAITGSRAGLVVLAGDDPGAWYSTFELDSREIAMIAEIPVLEPSNPAEGMDMMQEAFRLSEEYQIPVMIRIVLSYSEMKSEVASEKIMRPTVPDAIFIKEQGRWVSKPENAHERHERLRFKLDRIVESFEHSVFNDTRGSAKKAVIAVGHVASEVFDIVGDIARSHFTLCKLGTAYPLPKGYLLPVLESVEEVAILEESQPIVETAIAELVRRRVLDVEVKGRLTGMVQNTGELFRWQIDEILSQFEPRFDAAKTYFPYQEKSERERAQKFCSGCPFHHAFRVLKQVISVIYHDDPPIIIGDEGCTMRVSNKPFNLIDASYNLGSAIPVAAGIAEMKPAVPVIAVMGDGAFFSSGINGLINAARNRSNVVVIIVDNDTFATTGFQPHAGSTYDLKDKPPKRISIDELVRACGVQLMRVVDPEDEKRTRQVFSEALAVDGLRVVILRAPCPLIL